MNLTELGQSPSLHNKMNIVWRLSVPAILAQISSIVMQYIDAAMVGNLGATASASIGLVASSTWLLGGMCGALATGFSVQVAHQIGANNEKKARIVLKNALVIGLIFSLILALIGAGIAGSLPAWLGAESDLWTDASLYFLIYALSIPAVCLGRIASASLECSGNMKVPSILNASMCGLDVIFNFIFIRYLGVAGAALGTAAAELVIGAIMLWMACKRSASLRFHREDGWKIHSDIVRKAVKIAVPIGFEHTAICGAMVAATRIVAPLGTVAIAANSFAVTAESLCYMPGYGIGAAATTLVGQSVGAKKEHLAQSFSRLTLLLGCGVMAITAVIMYFCCPFVFEMLTPDVRVQELGVTILRIELFAEPLYGASIIASGALRGAGDTLIPSILNLVSIWGVRITLSILLVGSLGLQGVWIAMAIELCVRGILLLIRLKRGKWMKKILI